MFITVPLAWVLHGTKSSADAVSPWNSVISRCSVSMELGHQQMQCSLQTHTYFQLCSVGNFYNWIRISFFSLSGSSYHHLFTVIPKWRTAKMVMILTDDFIMLCRVLFHVVDMVDVWHDLYHYMHYVMSTDCVISEIRAHVFFARLLVTDRLFLDQADSNSTNRV